MTDILKALSDAATQGRFYADRANSTSIYMRHEDGIRGRHIADTGRLRSDALRHIQQEDAANAAFLAALVNMYRAGELVLASELAEARDEGKRQAVAIVQSEYLDWKGNGFKSEAMALANAREAVIDTLQADEKESTNE